MPAKVGRAAFKRYAITHRLTSRWVCEAPGPGAAVEFWVRAHGILVIEELPAVAELPAGLPCHVDADEGQFRMTISDPARWPLLEDTRRGDYVSPDNLAAGGV